VTPARAEVQLPHGRSLDYICMKKLAFTRSDSRSNPTLTFRLAMLLEKQNSGRIEKNLH
jgi:hypothetical protein